MTRTSMGWNAWQNGLAAEAIAAGIYLRREARVLAQRARAGGGEIDLIVRDAAQTVFVEVKARRSLDQAAHAISPRQIARIGAAAQAWLACNDRENDDIRFDVVLIDRNGNSEIVENALTFDS
jgi:putative endonuclease